MPRWGLPTSVVGGLILWIPVLLAIGVWKLVAWMLGLPSG